MSAKATNSSKTVRQQMTRSHISLGNGPTAGMRGMTAACSLNIHMMD